MPSSLPGRVATSSSARRRRWPYLAIFSSFAAFTDAAEADPASSARAIRPLHPAKAAP